MNTPLYADRTHGATYASAHDMVNAFLSRFAGPAQHLDAGGYAEVRRGSARVGIHVIEDKGTLTLLAPIMPVPKQGREALYRRLLELSFLATSDAAFAIDAVREEIVVRALRRLSGLDYEEFEDLLDTVASVADMWDDRLRSEFPQ